MDTSRIRLLRPCTDYRGWWLSSYSVVDVDCSVAASMCAAGTAEDATDADLRLDTRIPLTEDRVRIAHVFNSAAHQSRKDVSIQRQGKPQVLGAVLDSVVARGGSQTAFAPHAEHHGHIAKRCRMASGGSFQNFAGSRTEAKKR